MLHGIAASSGVGIGSAMLVRQDDFIVFMDHGRDPCREKYRFLEATGVFTDEIKKASAAIEKKAGHDEADILRTQAEIARDPDLGEEILGMLDDHRINLEYAFATVCDRYIKLFSDIRDDLLRARMADFIDFRNQMLAIIMNKQRVDFSDVPRDSIIVADDIPPSCAATIEPQNINGIVTQNGSVNSHIAIIARAMGLPTIVSVHGIFEHVSDGDTLVVDGDVGQVVNNPDVERLHRYISYSDLPLARLSLGAHSH